MPKNKSKSGGKQRRRLKELEIKLQASKVRAVNSFNDLLELAGQIADAGRQIIDKSAAPKPKVSLKKILRALAKQAPKAICKEPKGCTHY